MNQHKVSFHTHPKKDFVKGEEVTLYPQIRREKANGREVLLTEPEELSRFVFTWKITRGAEVVGVAVPDPAAELLGTAKWTPKVAGELNVRIEVTLPEQGVTIN